jgi:hypothetical protein
MKGKRMKEMKKLSVGLVLSFVALCTLLSFSPVKAYADAFVYMDVTNVEGTSYNGEDVYPYYGHANGDPITLMCISFTADMNLGETWHAMDEVLPLTPQFEEAAWLFTDANIALALPTPDHNRQIADQWAAWELFDPAAYSNPAPGADTQLAAAEAAFASEPTSFYQGFIVYVPIPGTQSELGTAQFFLGYDVQSPVPPGPSTLPEPGSLILLGSGLLGLAGFVYRRRRHA